jgi:hypothetical protein
MKASDRAKLKSALKKHLDSTRDLRSYPEWYDENFPPNNESFMGELILELFNENRIDLGYPIEKKPEKIAQNIETLSEIRRFMSPVRHEFNRQIGHKRLLLMEQLKAELDNPSSYPIDAISSFSATLSRDYYDKTKAGRALGVTRQTIDNWLAKSHLGLKTELRGSRNVITREEMVRFYSELSKDKLTPNSSK